MRSVLSFELYTQLCNRLDRVIENETDVKTTLFPGFDIRRDTCSSLKNEADRLEGDLKESIS
jgi:hypothetical protein